MKSMLGIKDEEQPKFSDLFLGDETEDDSDFLSSYIQKFSSPFFLNI